MLVEDRTSQNALSSFLGTFVFAIVGLVALSTSYYDTAGRTILFLATLVVIVYVVVALLRWISHLSGFGRMADVIDRVEAAADRTLSTWSRAPHLGASAPVEVPPSALSVLPEQVGYVTFVDVPALDAVARSAGVVVHLAICPGSGAELSAPVAWIEGELGEPDEVVRGVRRAVRIEHHRTFEQDPRLGVIALAEIGSRALSPAVNDPGTAVQIIAALDRVFSRVLRAPEPDEPTTDRVHAPSPAFADLLDDAFRPIARDGADKIEIALRLQRCLGSLAAIADGPRADALREAAHAARARAERGLTFPPDAELLRSAS
ncbi:DUF2254 domain-containing protein [Schumannella luteola]|nr:DUF2254 domain-containing protein [Schumannella luteola]